MDEPFHCDHRRWLVIRALQKCGLTNTVLPFGRLRVYVSNPPGGEAFLGTKQRSNILLADPCLQAVLALVDGAETFWDVGANCGLFSLFCLSKKPALKVVSLEPSSEHYSALCRNRILNPAPDWLCLNVAACRTPGVTWLTTGLGGFNHITGPQGERGVSSESCLGMRLDDLAALVGVDSIDVLKLDVEGFELDALQGAEGLLRQRRIRALVIEADGHGIRYGSAEGAVEKYLLGFGYKVDQDLTSIDRPDGNCLVVRAN